MILCWLKIIIELRDMILYTLLTVLLIVLGMLTFVPKYQDAINRFSTGINFFLTLIATLFGVLLAMAFANIEEEQKEKEHVVKLMQATIAAIESSHDYSEELFEFYLKMPKQDEARSQFFAKNPLPFPDYLNTFMAQSLVNRTLSEKTLIDLNEYKFNLQKTSNGSQPQIHLLLLTYTIEALSLEITYQKGEKSLSELEQAIDRKDKKFNLALDELKGNNL
jgi:predicted outer membrane lipoprotein